MKPIEAAERCVELMGKASHTLGRLGSAYAAAGNLDAAQAALDEMQRRWQSAVTFLLIIWRS